MDPSLMPKSLGGLISAAAAILFGSITAWQNLRKGKVDETVAVLASWKEMIDRHEDEIKRNAEELRAERKDNAELRTRLRQAESLIDDQANEIRELRKEVAGLQAQLVQHAKSTGNILQLSAGASPGDIAPAATDRFSVDKLRGNPIPKDQQDLLDRLDISPEGEY